MPFRKIILSSVMPVLLACVMVGCGDSGQSKEDGSIGTPYSVNGIQVHLGDNGEDGTVSVLAEATGDLNKDGRDDRAVILVQNGAGSGVFYFLNVFLHDKKGELQLIGEEFLGDRIKFDAVDIYKKGSKSSITGVAIHPGDYGQLMVAFSTRINEQSFADHPGFYVAKHWKVEGGKLVLVENY